MRDSRRSSYPRLEERLRETLDRDWTTARRLASRLDEWRLVSIRHALSQMTSRGEVELRNVVLTPQKSVNEYRLHSNRRERDNG